MSLFLTTLCLVFVLGITVVLFTQGRLAPRHLLVIFIVSLGIATAVPAHEHTPDSLMHLGLSIIFFGICLGIELELRHRRKMKATDASAPDANAS